MNDELDAMEAAAEREMDVYRAEVDRVKADAQVKLDAHRDEITSLRDQAQKALAAEGERTAERDALRALLGRAVRELDDDGLPSHSALAAELARDGALDAP